jgi:hypothetical protein
MYEHNNMPAEAGKRIDPDDVKQPAAKTKEKEECIPEPPRNTCEWRAGKCI